MMTSYLNCGQLLVVDNFYTSVPLARQLFAPKTHLLGTVCADWKKLLSMKQVKLSNGKIIIMSDMTLKKIHMTEEFSKSCER